MLAVPHTPIRNMAPSDPKLISLAQYGTTKARPSYQTIASEDTSSSGVGPSSVFGGRIRALSAHNPLNPDSMNLNHSSSLSTTGKDTQHSGITIPDTDTVTFK